MGNSIKSLVTIQIRNGSMIPISSLGTAILSYNVRNDGLDIQLENAFNTSLYTYTTDNAYVRELIEFQGKFAMVVGISGSLISINVKRTSNEQYCTLRDMYNTMSLGFACKMDLVLDPSPTSPLLVNNYSTIQARDTIGNINVYVNGNGDTNYYDTTIPITVNLGSMSFNTLNGEYKLPITLTKSSSGIGVKYDSSSFPYIVSSQYSNNKIILTCTQSSNGFLIANINNVSVGVPYQLTLEPNVNGNIIEININGTNLNDVNTDFIIEITLIITIIL